MRKTTLILVTTSVLACAGKDRREHSDSVDRESTESATETVDYEPLEEDSLSDLDAAIYTALLERPSSSSTQTLGLSSARLANGPKARGPIAARLYRRKAEATVAIRLPNGHGSGFLLEPAEDRWIVTNHHVAAAGTRDQEGRFVVTVEFGRLVEGVMQRDPNVGRASVYDWDRDRDLALLKLDELPPVRAGIEIASRVPTPGSSVVLLGQGGVGLMWQVRECEVSAIGTLGDDFSLLPTDCHQIAKVAPEALSRCREMVETTRSHRIAEVRFVQSTCQLAGGDSGGPLLNPEGDLIGVSSFYRTSPDPGRTTEAGYFHIHRDEVVAFLDEAHRASPLSGEPATSTGFAFGALPADQPLKGRTRVVAGTRVAAVQTDAMRGVLVDLGRGKLPPRGAFSVRRGALEVEFALSITPKAIFAEYDEDFDGEFDLVLSAGPASLPATVEATRSGRVRPEYLGQKLVRTDIFDEQRSRRLMSALSDVLPPTLLGDAGRMPISQFPDGYDDVGPKLAFDGVDRALVVYSGGEPAEAWLVDLDNDSLPPGATGAVLRRIYDRRQIDWELAIVHSEPLVWTFYDFDAAEGPEHISFSMGRRGHFDFFLRGFEMSVEKSSTVRSPCRLDFVPEAMRARVDALSKKLFRRNLCR